MPELIKAEETEVGKNNYLERDEFTSLFAEHLPKEEPKEPFKLYLDSTAIQKDEDEKGRTLHLLPAR